MHIILCIAPTPPNPTFSFLDHSLVKHLTSLSLFISPSSSLKAQRHSVPTFHRCFRWDIEPALSAHTTSLAPTERRPPRREIPAYTLIHTASTKRAWPQP